MRYNILNMKKKSFSKKLLHQLTLNKFAAKENLAAMNEQDEAKGMKLDVPKIEEIEFASFDEIQEETQKNTTENNQEKKSKKLKQENFFENNHIIDKPIFPKTNKHIEEKAHYAGHRGRVKQKILDQGPVNLKDYELLEALLTYSIPRSDTKPLAKRLLEHFNSLQNLFLADNTKLKQVKGIGDSTICFFSIIHEITCRMAREEIMNQVVLNTPDKVINYCRLRMSGLSYEQFYVLFLNRKNKLILDEVVQSGTIDKAAIFPRELVKRAIDLGAGAMILVHNHPSGDPTPSKADIESTINIQKAAKLMEIFLYDHIIIGKNKHYSMRSNKII